MKHVCIWLIKLYQKFISPLKKSCCRFTPSCSAYAVEAFSKRGFFVGFFLSAKRICRCNPFSVGGYDPVPPKKIPKYRDTAETKKTSKHNDDAKNK